MLTDELSLWIHFGSVLVASATAAFFFLQFSIRLPAPLHLCLLLLPIPWLVAGIGLSRRPRFRRPRCRFSVPHAAWLRFASAHQSSSSHLLFSTNRDHPEHHESNCLHLGCHP